MAAPTTPSPEYYNNIPTGLLVPAQVPLDAKRVVLTNAILQDLGTDDNLAFTYEDGLIVYSVQSKQRWEWREVRPSETDTALLATPFVYPASHVIAGVTYSSKSYNFFLKREPYLLSNVGSGEDVYKGFNVVNERHEFYTLKTDDKITLSYPSGDPGVLLFTFPNFLNLTDQGVPVFKGYNPSGNKFEFYTLDSTDITINKDDVTGKITFILPQSSSVPSIYINQGFQPSYDDWLKANKLANPSGPTTTFAYKGEGTLAKPFTNTGTYTLGNTNYNSWVITEIQSSIKNGFDHYVGLGSRLDPEREGQKIQILASPFFYVYDGDFNYTGLNLEINSTVSCTNTGRLLDLNSSAFESDLAPPTKNVVATINIIGENTDLIVYGTGFFNSGNNIALETYEYRKQIELFGTGKIFSVVYDPSKFMINAGVTQPTYFNAGHGTFNMKVNIHCLGQGVILNSGKSRMEVTDVQLVSGSILEDVNPNLEAIKITGGRILIRDGSITLFNGTEDSALFRNRGIVFDGPAGTPEAAIIMRNVTFVGNAKTWFDRKGVVGNINVSNCSTLYFGGAGTTLFGTSGTIALPNRVWGKDNAATEGYVNFANNAIENTTIDFSKVDFTINGQTSAFNTIGKYTVASLRTFSDMSSAKTDPVPVGGLFLRKLVLTDASHLNSYRLGDEFEIVEQSSTPFDFGPYALGGGIITAVGTLFRKNLTPSSAWPTGVKIAYYQLSVVS